MCPVWMCRRRRRGPLGVRGKAGCRPDAERSKDVWGRRVRCLSLFFFFFSSRRRHTRFDCDWSSDVCSSDLAPVPLFVKRPWQRGGAVDDGSARSIDIVPTIADALGIKVPWHLDGESLFARSEERRVGKECRSRWSPYH